MELKLKNIGIIKDSTIKLDGLTVITGFNNSGKTTIGRTLFSIISAVENLQTKAINDKIDYSKRAIRDAIENFEFYRYMRSSYMHETSLNQNSFFVRAINGNYELETIKDVISFIEKLIVEIENLTIKDVIQLIEEPINQIRKKRIEESFIDIDIKKKETVKLLNQLIQVIDADPNLIAYSNARIIKTLKNEFYGQIQPVKGDKSIEAKIVLKDKDKKYFDIAIANNDLSNKKENFINLAFRKAIYIDNVFLLDAMTSSADSFQRKRIMRASNSISDYTSFLDNLSCSRHDYNLLENLLTSTINIFEETVNKEKAEEIMALINQCMPDSIMYVDSKFVASNYKLDIRNLATGSKMFAILSKLIENGQIDSKTMLILDEPESHLHPEWQNVFAEVIILLVKNLNVNVVLTTHNTNFMLAIETFMIKHKIIDKCNFYKNEVLEDKYMVKCTCVNQNLNEIYADFVRPYAQLTKLRENLLNDEE